MPGLLAQCKVFGGGVGCLESKLVARMGAAGGQVTRPSITSLNRLLSVTTGLSLKALTLSKWRSAGTPSSGVRHHHHLDSQRASQAQSINDGRPTRCHSGNTGLVHQCKSSTVLHRETPRKSQHFFYLFTCELHFSSSSRAVTNARIWSALP